MKNYLKKLKIILPCALIVSAVSAVCVFANPNSAYATETDPIVALSYLNDVFLPQIRGEYNGSAEALQQRIGQLEAEIDGLRGDVARTRYEVVFLERGDKITADYPCEIILRSGEAAVISPGEGLGINDITDGRDAGGGEGVPAFHCFLIPRGGDGRGITVTSEDGAYFMVRGGYVIVKANG